MATYNWLISIPFSASGDMSDNQYKFVTTATTAERVLLATGACGPMPIGVLQNDPNTGEEAQVGILGVTQMWLSCSTGVSYGDFVFSGSAGGAELHGVTAGSVTQGMALETMAAGSGYFKMLILPQSGIITDNTP